MLKNKVEKQRCINLCVKGQDSGHWIHRTWCLAGLALVGFTLSSIKQNVEQIRVYNTEGLRGGNIMTSIRSMGNACLDNAEDKRGKKIFLNNFL